MKEEIISQKLIGSINLRDFYEKHGCFGSRNGTTVKIPDIPAYPLQVGDETWYFQHKCGAKDCVCATVKEKQ
jgi:hypothetical protein